MYCTQATVCIPHQYQLPGHDPYLWWGSKSHRKDTLEACGGVPRSQEIPLGLDGGPEEEYGLIGEDWGHDGAEMELGRKEWEEKWR